MSIIEQARTVARKALAQGALQSFRTQSRVLEQQNIPFIVRIADSLNHKPKAPSRTPVIRNPFLPYEQSLFVCELGSKHVCLLNKFNVIDDHLLIITKEYQPQSCWLELDDFSALTPLLQEFDGLGFYNGGTTAGASQHHKHLQYIPRQALAEGKDLPWSHFILSPLPRFIVAW
ncbi:DUF4922 domain-containing protein [Dongshaea marina]|uniref:DUF4922 domain-containing protein n=1 Tax=Dongshaea marina TaxID=2047966 RepID=UPI000D3E974C|nr:DUF4922 domain-containing protein [Dongshaea marina]